MITAPGRRRITLKIDAALFGQMDADLASTGRDDDETEVAGFLLCRSAEVADGRVNLLARRWLPVPLAMRVIRPGYGLAWKPEFNAAIADEAEASRTHPVLVHRHAGQLSVTLGRRDRQAGRPMLAAMSRSLGGPFVGMIVYDDHAADGEFWRIGQLSDQLVEMVVVGAPIRRLRAIPARVGGPRMRLARQSEAIGPLSDAALAHASVALVGLSGGGSHCAQQLAHQGFGTFFLIDDELVDATNRGRLVGSRTSDDGRHKTAVAKRLIKGIDRRATVIRIDHRSSHCDAIAAIAAADLVVSCVDTFGARAEINALCRRYLVPMIDVGMTLISDGERLTKAVGQVVLTCPGGPCIRCLPLVSDAVLNAETKRRRPGYDQNEYASGDPQVVSMNGVLASQAANVALALVTGYLPVAADATGAYWQYDGLAGRLEPCGMPPRRAGCPGCAEDGEGDFI